MKPETVFLTALASRACAAFAVPVQAVLLLGIRHRLVTHELLEHLEIHGHAVRPLGDEFGEERLQPVDGR